MCSAAATRAFDAGESRWPYLSSVSYQEIISAAREFSREERRRLAAALLAIDEPPSADTWDDRIAADAEAGKLDFLFDEVAEAKRAGGLTPLYEGDAGDA